MSMENERKGDESSNRDSVDGGWMKDFVVNE